MTGSVALDVAIGLIFIFLIYSLLSSVILELLASFFRLRARNLSYALGRLLTDQPTFSLKGFLLGSLGRKKNPDLRDRLYNQPMLRRTARGLFGSKPSYIHAKNLSESLLNVLKEAAGVEAIAARGTMNAIHDKLLEFTHADGATEKQNAIDPQTAKMLAEMLRNTGYDLHKFELRFQAWYNNSMERVAGWYKQWTQVLLLFIGFMMAVAFNVDTISIAEKLAHDPDAREQLVKLAEAKAQTYSAMVDSLRTDPVDSSDTAKAATVQHLKHRSIQELNDAKQQVQADLDDANAILGLGWGIYDTVLLVYPDSTCAPPSFAMVFADSLLKQPLDSLATMPHLSDKELEFYAGVYIQGQSPRMALAMPGIWPRFKYGLSKAMSSSSSLIGLLITALAISLGAPFWFDMLNKLVKVRSTITGGGNTAKEEQKENTNTQTA